MDILWIDHFDDGSISVEYSNFRRERITGKEQITAICKEYREQKWARENSPPHYPTLVS